MDARYSDGEEGLSLVISDDNAGHVKWPAFLFVIFSNAATHLNAAKPTTFPAGSRM
jgi:hypothetical protein